MHTLSLGMLCVSLWVALGVDRAWGEPPLRWHPVVWMGQYLAWAGERIAPLAMDAMDAKQTVARADWPTWAKGVAAWSGGALFVSSLAWGVQDALLSMTRSPHAPVAWAGHALAAVCLGVLLKPMLAWRFLEQEVQAVEAALQNSLEEGRDRLAWICSRDTASLSETQVRETAIESLAENLNDSVVAPLFWFVCLGLPGAVLYRFANTADAMWGYRGEREGRQWEWAGKWAAHLDDGLSWLPARLTAVALMLASRTTAWRGLRQQAGQTPSPNSGWPMAAMALALHVRLGKPGVYVLHAQGQAADATHLNQACALSRRAVLGLATVWTGMALGLTLGLATLEGWSVNGASVKWTPPSLNGSAHV